MPLEGKKVILREERLEDLPHQVKLRNNLATQAWSKTLPPDYTLEMYQKRYEKREFSFDREDGRFTVITKEDEEYVGYVSYYDYEPRFSVTIGIVADEEFWGKGLAYDAQETLLKFLFLELGVRVVRLWTQSGNKGAVRLAKRSGFQISGTLRNTAYIRGKIRNTLVIDLLREEYFARHPELEDVLPSLT
jgi:RimJ/RimL family protein N-acetyltransferase